VFVYCGCSSMAERQLPKLDTRVRFSSPAPRIPSGQAHCPTPGAAALAVLLTFGGLVCHLPRVQAQGLEIELEAAIGAGSYSSLERSAGGALLNQESGALPLQGLHARVKKGAWSIAMNLSRHADTLDYLGVTQSGLPIGTRTQLALVQQGVSLGRQVELSPSQDLIGRIGLRGLDIDRQILPGPLNSALHERLRATFFGVGLGYRWTHPLNSTFKVHLGLDLDWQQSTGSSLSFDTFGRYDLATLTPQRFSLLEFAIGLRFEHSSGFYSGLRLTTLNFSPSSSPSAVLTQAGAPVALVTYPGSTQRVKTSAFLIGWRY
jgi:hypothetical protein